MSLLKLPDEYTSVSPIIVSAPATRCGTTFLQRLLSSGDNSILFGENLGGQMELMTEFFVGILQELSETADRHDAALQAVLDGDLSAWRPGLLPAADVYLGSVADMYFATLLKTEAYCARIGRPVWGLKYPGWGYIRIKAMRSIMPRARFIYIYRDVYDCARSAKARGWAEGPIALGKFARDWAANLISMADLNTDPAILFLKYEDMIADPKAYIDGLEEFTGAQGLKLEVFDIRVNTFQGAEEEGRADGQYVAPEPLSRDELAAVRAAAGHVMDHLYPNKAADPAPASA